MGEQPAPLNSADVRLHDCWNTVGINGDGSCAELVQHVHCRNCPVFARAGARLLDQPVHAEYRQQWTKHIAALPPPQSAGRVSLLIFRVGAEWFGIATAVVQEVVETRLIHSVPHRHGTVVLGIVNIRGELLVCVSVGRLLGVEQPVPSGALRGQTCRLVVVSSIGGRLVFPVAEVGGIERFDVEEFKDVPSSLPETIAGFTRGILSWQAKAVGWLDEELLLNALEQSLHERSAK